MNSTPTKPLPCNQKWADMIPFGKNGRVCLGCGKVVTDFRNYKMKEIVKTHTTSIIPVCGIYTDKQLNEWGQRKNYSRLIKFFSASSILLALSNMIQGEVFSQTKSTHNFTVSDSTKSQKLIHIKKPIKYISGTVVHINSDSTKRTIKGASIVLQNDSSFNCKTDSLGRFKINISRKYSSLTDSLILFVSHPDYLSQSLSINKNKSVALKIALSEVLVEEHSVPLINIINTPAYFYAKAPEIEKPDTTKNKKWWQKKKK